MRLPALLTMAGALALGAAAAHAQTAEKAADTARATVKNTEGKRVGTVTLTQTPNGTLLRVKLSGVPAGIHGFHVHTTGACTPPFKSAGGHFDPGQTKHGIRVEGGPHAGDMPNILVPQSGELEVEILNTRLALNDTLFDDDGAAIVIHAKGDDYESQPSGDAGDRIACGVIER